VKIWRFADPFDYNFAIAGLKGTWGPIREGQGPCPECNSVRQRRIQPMIIEWEPGSEFVGDFSFLGGDSIAVTERVVHALQGKFKGFELGPVQMVQDPKLKRPTRITKRTKPRVWLPYEGPLLFDLWITSWVQMDEDRSTARIIRNCSTCGLKTYEVSGVEHVEYNKVEWKAEPSEFELLKWRIGRVSGQGIYVRRSDLKGADIFRVHEFPAWIFCTNDVKEFIEIEGYTNVTFFEMGELV